MKHDPEIRFSKVLCPVCMEPTGRDTDCHLSEQAQSTPKHTRKVVMNRNILPILSVNCYFRNTNLWRADTSHPVSITLVNELSDIPGLNNITPTLAYQFEFSVAPMFDEADVKKQIALKFRHFVTSRTASAMTVEKFLESTIKPVSSGSLIG